MEGIVFLMSAVCAIYIGCVASQDPSELDMGDVDQLGDILDVLNLGDVDLLDLGTEAAIGVDRNAPLLICYECGTSAELDKTKLERSCVQPSTATLNITCRTPPIGAVNHCGWMEATVSTPNPDNPEMSMELYWLFRGCVPAPKSSEIGEKCFTDADLVGTLDELGLPLTQIVGAGEDSSITGKGCFCAKDYCNGAATVGFPPLGAMLLGVLAAGFI